MAKSLLALALGLIGGVLIGYLANAMGLPGWMRIIAVLLCIVGGIMLMIEESKNKEEASVKQRDGSEH
jgi:putative Ca2+/H+ antiporter (TMEM165/GDT1 family)